VVGSIRSASPRITEAWQIVRNKFIAASVEADGGARNPTFGRLKRDLVPVRTSPR
jgi:hypothetical protein